jgi:hypothetical protein
VPTPTQVKVVDYRDAASAAPERAGKTDRIVVYELNPYQRYAVVLPLESFSEDALKEAIRRDLAERTQWQGKSLNL